MQRKRKEKYKYKYKGHGPITLSWEEHSGRIWHSRSVFPYLHPVEEIVFSNFQILKSKQACAVKSLTKLAMEESESGQMVKRKPCH